jgi:two-component system LytT family sensor kinase
MVNRLIDSRWFYHLLFWVVLVGLFGFVLGNNPEVTYKESFTGVVLQAMAYAVMVYLNLLVLIPRYLQTGKYAQYIAFLILSLALTVPLHAAADRLAHDINYPDVEYPASYIQTLLSSSINMLVMLALTTALKFSKKWFKDQQEKKDLEREKLQAELKYLKAQINPHFLFNTLNNLYGLTLKKSDEAPEMVMRLSEIMRYMLHDSNERLVPLASEINYLKNYIGLQLIRQLDRTEIRFDINQEPNGQSIAPLLLIPFIENSFKHGAGGVEKGWIHINVRLSGNRLTFRIENSKPLEPPDVVSHGIGLKNVQSRLELLYPDKHSLIIEDAADHYLTELKLELS